MDIPFLAILAQTNIRVRSTPKDQVKQIEIQVDVNQSTKESKLEYKTREFQSSEIKKPTAFRSADKFKGQYLELHAVKRNVKKASNPFVIDCPSFMITHGISGYVNWFPY